jgi:hypothetical protein
MAEKAIAIKKNHLNRGIIKMHKSKKILKIK